MHRTTLLMPEHLWRDVQRRAAEEGISASEFIRESLMARLYYEKAQHDARKQRPT